ncbi:MAG: pilus assembly protein [Pseudomonadota bacterium]|nr:pilus assembly protein [Pseudomonadota bacterium]
MVEIMRKQSAQLYRPRQQSGAALVEFAFVFPILFLLVYGVIVYAYVYVIQQSITFAAQEGAAAAVSVDPATANPLTVQQEVVRSTVSSALSWLPESQRARVLGAGGERVQVVLCPQGSGGCPIDSNALRVTLNFTVRPAGSDCATGALFPMLNLFLVGCIPPLPETLSASAVVRI